MDESSITFTPLTKEDLPNIYAWLNTEHVRRRWGNKAFSYHDVEEKYFPVIDKTEPTVGYIIRYNNQPIGLIQTYKVDSYPDYKTQIGIEENAAGLDLFIGDVNFIGRGLGTKIIGKFTKEIIFTLFDVDCVVVDPAIDNPSSIKAFQKAGYVYVKDVFDAKTGQKEVLLKLSKL